MKVFYRTLNHYNFAKIVYDCYYIKKSELAKIETYAENLGWVEYSTDENYFLCKF